MSICIVTPVLNAVNTIDDTIWSVLTQQSRNCRTNSLHIRYHVQDGGSTDGTVQKIQEWEKKIHSFSEILPSSFEFTWASEPDTGMYDAINKGFSHCVIEQDSFMGWINADDMLFPGALDTVDSIASDYPQVEWLLGWQIGLSHGGALITLDRLFWHTAAIVKTGIMDGFFWPFIQQESTFWKKSLWDKAGGVDSRFKCAGDYALWLSFAQHAEPFKVNRQLGSFSYRKEQITSDMTKYFAEMDTCFDAKSRRSNFSRLLKENVFFQKFSLFIENEDGSWRLVEREYSLLKKIFCYMYKCLPNIPKIKDRLRRRLFRCSMGRR